MNSIQIHDRNSAGVYALINVKTGEKYVGRSYCIRKRLNQHFTDMKRECHGNSRIQQLYNAYGRESFVWCLVKEANSHQERVVAEQECLSSGLFDINFSRSATGGSGPHTEETRRRLSKSLKGKLAGVPKTESHRRKIKEANSGENSYQFHGYYHVPWGVFASGKQASIASNGLMTRPAILNACNDSGRIISQHSWWLNKYIRANYDESIIGKTYKDAGFWFEPVNPSASPSDAAD